MERECTENNEHYNWIMINEPDSKRAQNVKAQQEGYIFKTWIWSIQIDFIAIFRFEQFYTIYVGFLLVVRPIH